MVQLKFNPFQRHRCRRIDRGVILKPYNNSAVFVVVVISFRLKKEKEIYIFKMGEKRFKIKQTNLSEL